MARRSIAPQRGFFPQPAYVIGAFRDDGEPNFTLITWITFCSVSPPTVMFASRGEKMTPTLVVKTRAFSANLVTTGMVQMADYFGNTSGYQTSKCADTGVAWSRGSVLDVPVLDDSPWVFECALVNTVHQSGSRVFFGEVKNILIDHRVPDPTYGKVDMGLLDPVVYAPVHYYAVGHRVATVGDARQVFPVGGGK